MAPSKEILEFVFRVWVRYVEHTLLESSVGGSNPHGASVTGAGLDDP